MCPVVDELFPFSLCLYFPVETDTGILFSWAKMLPGRADGTRPLTVLLAVQDCRWTVRWPQVAQRWSAEGTRTRMTPHSLWPFPLPSRLWPDNVLSTKNGVINQRTVSDVILKTTMDKNRANGDIFCCFCWSSADCPPHKYSRFTVEGNTPAILQRKTSNKALKKNQTAPDKGVNGSTLVKSGLF